MTPILAGVCSVTFRALSVEEVAQLAASAGVQAIEWGGDVHVPPGVNLVWGYVCPSCW